LSNVHLGAKQAVIDGLVKNPEEVPGMSRVYRSLWTKGASLHYVSASPWQIFPVLVGFFRSFQFPPGSAHLRIVALMDRQALKEKSSVKKRVSIRQLLETFPKRKFIMVGDSGEDDMMTYGKA
jgi:phosphatidate phosphatase APP1